MPDPNVGDEDTTVVKTSRDPSELRGRLQEWLVERTTDPNATVGAVSSPEATGMSSESLFFDAAWDGGGGSFVARVAPSNDDVPVFPSYDLEMQYEVIETIRLNSSVPVPSLRWLETDPRHLDVPFFVMDRVDGRVPTDIPPYAMGGWVVELGPDGRSELQRASLGVLARIHGIDLDRGDLSFLEFDAPGDTPLRRHCANQHEMYEWVCAGSGRRYPAIEHAFEWIERNWPDDEPAAISWGDSRIGNIMYDPGGTNPVAVLDWEMAGLAPPSVDVGWMCFMHLFFDHVLGLVDLDTLPDMFRPEEVREQYGELTGNDVGDLKWELAYAGMRHAIIMSRIHERHVHFGMAERADDPDDGFMFKGLLEELTRD